MIDYYESIDMFEFSARASNQLRKAEILTVGDLVSKTEYDIYHIHWIGAKTIDEIKSKLKEYGMSLGMNPVNKLTMFGTDAIKDMSRDVDKLVSRLSEFNKEVDVVVDKLKELKDIVEQDRCPKYVWHKYPDEKPPIEGWYLATRRDGKETFIDLYKDYQKDGELHFARGNDGMEDVIAWTLLPRPYEVEND